MRQHKSLFAQHNLGRGLQLFVSLILLILLLVRGRLISETRCVEKPGVELLKALLLYLLNVKHLIHVLRHILLISDVFIYLLPIRVVLSTILFLGEGLFTMFNFAHI